MFPKAVSIKDLSFPQDSYSMLEIYPENSLPEVTRINEDGKEVIIYTSDVYNLFNQERFAGVAQNIVDSIRSNILAGGSQYQSILDGLSDQELMSAIKPRSLQSPSELMEYSKRVMNYLDLRLKQTQESSSDVVEELTKDVNSDVNENK